MIVKTLISPDLLEQLEATALEEGRGLQELLNDLVADYVNRRHDDIISAESERFREMHATLWAQYPHEYVAMRHGEVLDHDSDLASLHDRIREQFGRAPILIAPVLAQPDHEYRIRRPRLASTAA